MIGVVALDLLAQLHALGAAHVAKPPPLDDSEFAAIGPCAREPAADEVAIGQRLLAWVKATDPHETVDAGTSFNTLRFGCVEHGAVVVDASLDRRKDGGGYSGHWWTFRVTPEAITVVTELTGLSTMDYLEWSTESFETTLALADVDGDGALDVVTERRTKEGGSAWTDITWSVEPARGGGPIALARFHGKAELAPGDALVVALSDHANYDEAVYRCLGLRGLTRCPAADAAQRRGRAAAAAEALVRARALPDRDELAGLLAALDVPAADTAAFLASAPATSPVAAAERAVHEFASSRDAGLTEEERAAAARADAERAFAPLRALVGALPCAPGKAGAALGRRLAADGDVLDVPCASPGGATYATLVATKPDGPHALLVFDSGARATIVLDEPAGADPATAAPWIASFYQRGASLDALVVDGGTLRAFANGAPAGAKDGNFQLLAHDEVPGDVVAVDDFGSGWTADDRLRQIAPADPAAAIVAAELRRNDALGRLATFDGARFVAEVAYARDLLAALRVLGAPESLLGKMRGLAPGGT